MSRLLLSQEIKLIDKILDTTGDEQKNHIFLLFLHDPVFMNKVIFKRDMPPHQRMEMRLMWWRAFYEGNDGYRAGKSTTATYVQMQQCALMSGWNEGIISHTLRGTQYLFRDHIKYQYETNQVYRALIAKRPTMGSEWRIEYKNGANITAYPSDILNKSMRLESLSLHGATIDEATAFPDPDVLWDVMFNRVTMPVPPLAAKLGIANTVRVLGAAKYTYQLIYKPRNGKGGLVHHVIAEMGRWAEEHDFDKPLDYVFMSCNLDEHLPPDEVCWACDGNTERLGMRADGKEYVRCKSCGYERVAWRTFFGSTLKRMWDAKHLMGRKLFDMRWRGRWQETSDDVYSPLAVDAMLNKNSPLELKSQKGNKDIYAFGIDVGTGSSERHSVSAITVLKFSPPDPHFRCVHARKYACSLTHLSGHIHNLASLFSPSVIMLDPGGGGVWLADRDHLGNEDQTIMDAGKTIKTKVTPIAQMGELYQEGGKKILVFFTPANYLLEHSRGKMVASDQLINYAHELTSGLIESGLIFFPAYGGDEKDFPVLRQEVMDCMQEIRTGLLSIGVEQNQSGDNILTKNGFFQYTPRPDLAYSFVYGVTGMYLYNSLDQDAIEGDVGEAMGIISDSIESIGTLIHQPSTGFQVKDQGFAVLV